jgi:hypothetical protein
VRTIDLEAPLALEVSWSLALAIGEGVGLPMPVIDRLIAVSGAMFGRDLRGEGRILSALGLHGRDGAGLRRFAEVGT